MEKAIKKYFPIFALPTAIAFFIFFLAPFVLGVYLSFCEFTTITDAEVVGFDNYVKIFGDETVFKPFVHSLWYTALFAIVSVMLINVLALRLHYFLQRELEVQTFLERYFLCQT